MKAKRKIRQNRPGWKKIRGWGKKAIKTSRGLKKDQYGKFVYTSVRIKTPMWEPANGVRNG